VDKHVGFKRVYHVNDGIVKCFAPVMNDKNVDGFIITDNYRIYKLPLMTSMDTLKEKPKSRYGTFDIETYIGDKGEHHIYMLGVYVDSEYISFYLSDYSDESDMISAFLYCVKKYKVKTLYAHNGGRYDSVVIAKILSKKKVRVAGMPIEWQSNVSKENALDAMIISGRGFRVVLKDSLRLIPGSLRSLCKAFGVPTSKGIFPHGFITPKTLEYVGPCPDREYFKIGEDAISPSEYATLPSVFDLRRQAIEYNKRDCIALHEIMTLFQSMIYDLFQVNALSFNTIASLAYGC